MTITPLTRYAASFLRIGDLANAVLNRLRHLPNVAGNNTQQSQSKIRDQEVHGFPFDASLRTAAISLRERQLFRDAAERDCLDPASCLRSETQARLVDSKGAGCRDWLRGRILIDPRKLAENFASSNRVGAMRFFGRLKSTYVDTFCTHPDLCLPSLLVRSQRDTFKGALRPSVRTVLNVRAFTQISEPVVGSDAVDVIDKVRRPRAVNMQPNESVDVISTSPNGGSQVAVLAPTHSASSLVSVIGTHSPRHNPGLRIVSNDSSEFVGGQSGFVGEAYGCHDDAPKECGLLVIRRPGSKKVVWWMP